jgi:hypothetical protein
MKNTSPAVPVLPLGMAIFYKVKGAAEIGGLQYSLPSAILLAVEVMLK